MHDWLTRRAALKGMLSTGTLALARPASSLLPDAGLPGHPEDLEISLFSVSPRTVRITVQPVRDGEVVPLPSDGALADHSVQSPAARMRGLTGSRTIKCGQLRVTVASDPLSFRVDGPAGKLVQELTLDAPSSELRFDTGDGTLLGLGQGGPQFERRGDADRMVSGQGG